MRPRSVLPAVCLLWAAAGCNQPFTPTAPSARPPEEIFASQFGVGGAASRTFVVAEPGMVRLTLTGAGPPADVVVGVGVGIPRASGGGCHLNRWVETAASATPQLIVTTEAGTYCAQVFDAGHVTGEIGFSLRIERP
jgi:hypothetical protein